MGSHKGAWRHSVPESVEDGGGEVGCLRPQSQEASSQGRIASQ